MVTQRYVFSKESCHKFPITFKQEFLLESLKEFRNEPLVDFPSSTKLLKVCLGIQAIYREISGKYLEKSLNEYLG